jgi:electron transport complex protein RnfC
VIKSFPRGGVHPPEKKLSASTPIAPLPLPETVTIPLSQHIGAPSEVLVNRGDQVKVGQVIGQHKGFVSSNIHASVSGKVVKVDHILDSTGYKRPSVVIEVQDDEWLEGIDRSSQLKAEITLSREDIVKKTLEAGIVGMGGATFPSHVKMTLPKGKKAEWVILNGVECEPYLTSDHRLMLEKGQEILVGLKLIMKALGVEKGMVGIERNKPDAISYFQELCNSEANITVYPLRVKYPQGGEKQLIKALTGREVPSGGLPIDVGVVVHNVGTAFAVYEAVQKNKPLLERVVTVTGDQLEAPSNFLTRIGTPVKNLIEAAGGLPGDAGKIINGGPMMGKALSSLDVPVTKGTSGILIIPEQQSKRKTVEPCIRCARCINVCPMGLEPYLLMTLSEKELFERAEKDRVLDCIECGSCSFICPANRPLLDYIRLGKFRVGQIIRNRN